MDTDADPGEGVHLAGEAGLLGIRQQIRVHLCSSLVKLLCLGLTFLWNQAGGAQLRRSGMFIETDTQAPSKLR